MRPLDNAYTHIYIFILTLASPAANVNPNVLFMSMGFFSVPIFRLFNISIDVKLKLSMDIPKSVTLRKNVSGRKKKKKYF